MIGIELLGAFRQRHAALPVARIGQQLTEKSDGVAVHGVECEGPLRGAPEGLELFAEEQSRGQGKIRQMIGWRCLDRTPRGGCPAR